MEQSTFNLRFTGALLIISAIMVNLGIILRPVQLEDSFILTSFLQAHSHEGIWIWSFRIMIFGLFMQIMGLESLKSLFKQTENHVLISSGVIVCTLAWFAAAISQGYFMHMGAWAGWKVSTLDSGMQLPFLQTLDTTHEWVVCISRMSYMFFCMGMMAIGWGFLRTRFFQKYIGIYALVLGMSGILFMLAYDSNTQIYILVCYGITLFILCTGILLIIKSIQL